MSELSLTQDQQSAYEAFVGFITSPKEEVFVLEGYSGTGKSTLVRKLIEDLPKIVRSIKIIHPDATTRWDVALTATTNKAADNLRQITGHEVSTIHSKLGIIPFTNWKTRKTELTVRGNAKPVIDTILFIDEASYIDSELLQLIFECTERCKVVFIGDPAQLLTVGCKRSPVFNAGFNTAKLTEVVRQADGSPITDLATAFRETVNTGEFFSFRPDGVSVVHKARDEFEQAIAEEFTREGWSHNDSKVLAWTNNCVINYNQGIRNLVEGDPQFAPGDYAICNKYLQINKKANIKTDQLVLISAIRPANQHGVVGKIYTLDNRYEVFMPDSREEWKAAIRAARSREDFDTVALMTDSWADLRAAYACTINKAQGSTYDRVFIDLDDLKRCNNPDQLARMLYVGVSRARDNVVLTGDLV